MGNFITTRNKKDQTLNRKAESSSIKFFEQIQVNHREKWELTAAERMREINSVQDSIGCRQVGENNKTNFSFYAREEDDQESKKKTLVFNSRHKRKVFEIDLTSGNEPNAKCRFYFSKSKLGLETLVYGFEEQKNFFFSKVTMKRLVAAPSKDTYVITGDAEAAKLVSLPEFHKAIATLINQKARFELRHIKHKKFTILTYHLPDYHCLRLENTDLAGDRPAEIGKIVDDDKFQILQYLIFHNQRMIVCFSVKLLDKITLMVYKVTEDGSLKTLMINSIPISKEDSSSRKKPVLNQKLSEKIELIVVEYSNLTRFYNITEEGVVEVVYEYQKRRDAEWAFALLSEDMRVLRRENVVSICERYTAYEKDDIYTRVTKYQLEKFSL